MHIKASNMRTEYFTKQAGVTLIELLVGIAIGLLVVAVAVSALMVSRGVSGTVSEASSLQQQAAYAFRVIGQQIRQAGGLELALNPNFAAMGASNASPSLTPVAFDPPDAYEFNRSKSTISGKDSPAATEYLFSIGYQDYKEILAGSATPTSQFRNCLGQNDATDANAIIFSQFAHRNNEIVCKGNDGSEQPVIQNVASMKARFLTQDYSTGTPIMNYRTAAEVESLPNTWANVYAIEVCLELVGTETIDTVGTKYTNCENVEVDRGNRLRLVFKNVFQIRSQGQPGV